MHFPGRSAAGTMLSGQAACFHLRAIAHGLLRLCWALVPILLASAG